MVYKTFSKLGYGTAPLGSVTKLGKSNVGMGKQKFSDSLSSLQYAYDNGIKFYDTADLYGNGRVEKMLGSIFLKKYDIKICTKYGNRYYKNKIYFDTSSEYFNFSLENSLKRLKREKIDFYLLHSPPSDFVISNSLFNAINNAIKNGKILNFGISCRTVKDALKFRNNYDFIKCVEINYNLIDNRADNKLFNKIEKKDLFIISRAPFVNGMIFKKNLIKKFSKNDFRKEYDLNTKSWIGDQLNILKKNYTNLNIDTFALLFCLSNKKIDMVIPGMRSIDQIKRNIFIAKKQKLNQKTINYIKKQIPLTYQGWI